LESRVAPSYLHSRRDLLRRAALGATALALAACSQPATSAPTAAPAKPAATTQAQVPTPTTAPAPAPTTARVIPGASAATPSKPNAKTLSFLHETSFIPAFDDYFKQTLAPEYEKATGIKVDYELTSVGSVQTRVSTAVETNAGPDISLIEFNWAFLYDEKLVDLTDIADEIGKKSGGWYDSAKEAVVVNGKWKAIPLGNIGQLMVYRTDWFKSVGADKFPGTWQELLDVGTKLKEKGHPLGLTMGHGFGDNHGWEYPLLWSFGGHETDEAGKTIVLDSNETAQAVDFARTLYQKAQLPDVLGWTDPSNNKSYLAQQISCTNNASSILYAAKKDFPTVAAVTDHALNPSGPKGGPFQLLNPWSHSVFTFSKNQDQAKAFLGWLMDPDRLTRWLAAADAYYAPFLHAYDDAAMWKKEPRYLPYKDSIKYSHLPGWPAASNRQASESLSKYVIVDMFAKACQGQSTKDVINAAVSELKQIYG
jgi:multiple sugar transport system substrate-binding protein